jgi:PAS domain S-box-containing protein
MGRRQNRITTSKNQRQLKSAAARGLWGHKLLSRVRAAEKSLRRIPLRGVDALVVSGERGARVVTLKDGDSAYRMLVEAISEGAATISSDGVVLYCNQRLAELIGQPAVKVIGTMLQNLVHEPHHDRIERFLQAARKQPVKAEFRLRTRSGRLTPVQLSLNTLSGYRGKALGMVITDLTEQQRRRKKEIRSAEAIHRLILGREILAQEAERSRIARELHDEAGQLMTSLLVALRQLDDSKDLMECRELGKRLRQLTGQAIGEVGRLARGLHPIALDDHGLVAALTRYVEEYSQTHRISVILSLDKLESSQLAPAAQIALYRIVQEALTNVAKHAGAHNVKVVCRRVPRALEMTVIDDGRGFNFGKAIASDSASHLGLRSIRERSALLGGTASFTSTGTGAEVRVRIPFPTRKRIGSLKGSHS